LLPVEGDGLSIVRLDREPNLARLRMPVDQAGEEAAADPLPLRAGENVEARDDENR